LSESQSMSPVSRCVHRPCSLLKVTGKSQSTFIMAAIGTDITVFLTGCEARNVILILRHKVTGHSVYCIFYYMLICSARRVHTICNGVGYIEQVFINDLQPWDKPDTWWTSYWNGTKFLFHKNLRYCEPGEFCTVERIAFTEFAALCSRFVWPNVTWCLFTHLFSFWCPPPSLSKDNFRTCILSCTLYRTTGPG
jgi:hypothetical protein